MLLITGLEIPVLQFAGVVQEQAGSSVPCGEIAHKAVAIWEFIACTLMGAE